MFAATGSTITAATCPGLASSRRSTEFRSLYCAISVSCAAPRVTPLESGSPCVSAPEPAPTSIASEWPW